MKQVFAHRISETLPVFLVFGSFLVYLIAQHELIFLQHDDYGVAVLDYPAAPAAGDEHELGPMAVLRFLGDMYSEWSGRLLSLLALAASLAAGVEFMRAAQSIIVLAALLLAVALGCREADRRVHVWPSLLAVFAFLSMPAGTLTNGVYWFSAAAHYIWFLPLFLAACYVAGARRRLTPVSVVLLSAAALAHEQIAVAALVFAVSFLVFVQGDRPRDAWRALPGTIPIWAAASLCILAPGNFSRANAAALEGGLRAGLRENAALMGELFFAPGHDKNYFVYVILAAVLLLVVHAARQRRLRWWWPAAALAGFLAGVTVLYRTGHPAAYMVLLGAGYTAALAMAAWRRRPARNVLAVHLAGVASLAPLLLAPDVTPRSAAPFFVLGLVPLVHAFSLTPRPLGWLSFMLIAVFGVKAVGNAVYIYDGFKENARVMEINDQRLRAAALSRQTGVEPVATVELFKVPRPRFAEKMPYEKPVVGEWMKKYYGLDQAVSLQWRSPDPGPGPGGTQ